MIIYLNTGQTINLNIKRIKHSCQQIQELNFVYACLFPCWTRTLTCVFMEVLRFCCCEATGPNIAPLHIQWCAETLVHKQPVCVFPPAERRCSSDVCSCPVRRKQSGGGGERSVMLKVISVLMQEFNYVAAEEERGVNELADGSHSLSTQSSAEEHPL